MPFNIIIMRGGLNLQIRLTSARTKIPVIAVSVAVFRMTLAQAIKWKLTKFVTGVPKRQSISSDRIKNLEACSH